MIYEHAVLTLSKLWHIERIMTNLNTSN